MAKRFAQPVFFYRFTLASWIGLKNNRTYEKHLNRVFPVGKNQARYQMAFGKKYKSRKLEIDAAAIDRDSPEVKKRLDRIERNYAKLDEVLRDLETRIKLDDRLTSDRDNDDSVERLPNKPR